MRLVLPIELTNGNEGRRKHWGAAARRRKAYAATISFLYGKRLPVPTPVRITVVRVLGKGQRRWDPDSVGRGNAKELIDAIVAVGLIPDDSPKHVRRVEYRQDETRRADGPSVEVLIETVEGEA